MFIYVCISVPDPYVFGPPGSGSVIILYVSGSFHKQAKKFIKTLFSADFLSLRTDVNVPTESNKQNNLEKKTHFLLVSWKSLTKGAGSGAVNHVCGYKDLDPYLYQKVTDSDTLVCIKYHYLLILNLFISFYLC
jgi:hypothetical protein